jgi:hypothetical protein
VNWLKFNLLFIQLVSLPLSILPLAGLKVAQAEVTLQTGAGQRWQHSKIMN